MHAITPESGTAPAPQPHSERRPSKPSPHPILIAMGILQLLGAGLMLLASLLLPVMYIVAARAAAKGQGSDEDSLNALQIAGFSLTLLAISCGFGTLGIGSLMSKRWARAIGIAQCGMMSAYATIFLLTSIVAYPCYADGDSIAGNEMGRIFIAAMMRAVLIACGWTLTFLCLRPSVRSTCEIRNPGASWVDACPIPVLAAAIGLWINAATYLLMTTTGNASIPCFGTALTGMAALIPTLFATPVLLAIGWGLCRKHPLAWLAFVGVAALWCASCLATPDSALLEANRELHMIDADASAFDIAEARVEYAVERTWSITILAYAACLVGFFRKAPAQGAGT